MEAQNEKLHLIHRSSIIIIVQPPSSPAITSWYLGTSQTTHNVTRKQVGTLNVKVVTIFLVYR